MEIPKPSMLRNYLYEYTLIAFAAAIVFLTYAVFDLNKFIREKMMQELAASTEEIHRSTETIQKLKPQ